MLASSLFLLDPFHFQSNLGRFGAIIWLGDFLEPWMIQGLLGSNTFCGVVHKDLLKQIKEVLEELII